VHVKTFWLLGAQSPMGGVWGQPHCIVYSSRGNSGVNVTFVILYSYWAVQPQVWNKTQSQ